MHVEFISRNAGPERLVCEAELHFGDEGLLAGLILVGFSLWRGTNSDVYVTFPSRAFGAGSERRYFDYLRGDKEAVARFKTFVLDAYAKSGGGVPPATPATPGSTPPATAPGIH